MKAAQDHIEANQQSMNVTKGGTPGTDRVEATICALATTREKSSNETGSRCPLCEWGTAAAVRTVRHWSEGMGTYITCGRARVHNSSLGGEAWMVTTIQPVTLHATMNRTAAGTSTASILPSSAKQFSAQ